MSQKNVAPLSPAALSKIESAHNRSDYRLYVVVAAGTIHVSPIKKVADETAREYAKVIHGDAKHVIHVKAGLTVDAETAASKIVVQQTHGLYVTPATK